MEFKKLEDWCKFLEKSFSPELMIPKLPVIIRLDGNNFSKYTKKFNKPFDNGFSNLMIETTKHLVEHTNAIVGFTQSDEITLILYSDDIKKLIYHNGRKQKILSKLTGVCNNFFNENKDDYINNKKFANFDCRIYQTPTLHDATLQLLWRENDGTRNSIYMLANHYFSQSTLQNMKSKEMKDKLINEKNINWNDLDSKFKRGTYVRSVITSKKFTDEELESLPEKHHARQNKDLVIERRKIEVLDIEPLSKIENKVELFFSK